MSVSQAVEIEFWVKMFPLCPPFLPQLDVYGGADEAVVCPVVIRAYHGPGDVDIPAISGPDYYIINEMPTL